MSAFWVQHLDAQFAIAQEGGLAAVYIDLKRLPGGRAPSGADVPRSIGGAYVESPKSGGLDYLFLFWTELPDDRSTRETLPAECVDVFHAGLLTVAPNSFTNAARPYRVFQDGGIPVSETMERGLTAFAPSLARAWEEKWVRSKAGSTARRDHTHCGQ